MEETEESESAPISSLELSSLASSSPLVLPFARVAASTDLNLPPPNWLRSAGLPSSPAPTAALSSFGLAGLEDSEQAVLVADLVAPAENVKSLLKVPWDEEQSALSMLVHRVGNALLLDDFDLRQLLLDRPPAALGDEETWRRFREMLIGTLMKDYNKSGEESSDKGDKEETKQEDSDDLKPLLAIASRVKKSTRSVAIRQRNLVSKFLYHSRFLASDTNDEDNIGDNDDDQNETVTDKNSGSRLPRLPDERNSALVPTDRSVGEHHFARSLMWRFEDLRMLIGSDMPIFGDGDHPCVSLRLHESQKPIHVLTGLDYWLDNLMCQVPEVLMCYHLNGIVQNYELIKTEELPRHTESSRFSPSVVVRVAKNILAFLKANAAREGHTYWLFKAKGDDVVKLYDLTSLCDEANKNKKEKEEEETEVKNPFSTAVAMLFYKVARNVMESVDFRTSAGTVKRLLEKCIKLLDSKLYPQIASSARFMLADLLVPSDTTGEESDVLLVEEEEKEDDLTKHMVSVEALKTKLPNVENSSATRSKPSRQLSREERCRLAIETIVSGLEVLDAADLDQEERMKRDAKLKEMEERDNLRMTRPQSPIPMPYVDSSKGEVQTHRAQIEEREAWSEHLRSLLMQKAFGVYFVRAKADFESNKLGNAIRNIKRALLCHQHQREPQSECQTRSLTETYSLLADCYMGMVRVWSVSMVDFIEQFNTPESGNILDEALIERCTSDALDVANLCVKLPKDISEGMQLAMNAVSRALHEIDSKNEDDSTEDGDKNHLLHKLGHIHNEMSSLAMDQAVSLIRSSDEEDEDGDENNSEAKKALSGVVDELLDRSMEHLDEASALFKRVDEKLNLALVLSNTGRNHRVRAYFEGHVRQSSSSEMSQKEQSLYEQSLQCYHSALGLFSSVQRRSTPELHSSIALELSGALLSLATELQRYPPLSRIPKRELERDVVDYLMQALKVCGDLEDETRPRLNAFQMRSATIHRTLASMHHSSFRNEGSKHMRQLAESHYSRASKIFSELETHDQLLTTQLEWAGLREFVVENNNTRKNVLLVLQILLAPETVAVVRSVHKEAQMDKWINVLVERLLKHLLALVRSHVNKSNNSQAEKAKEVYRLALTMKTMEERSKIAETMNQIANMLQDSLCTK